MRSVFAYGAGLVDSMLSEAYVTVKTVADNMEAIENAAQLVDGIEDDLLEDFASEDPAKGASLITRMKAFTGAVARTVADIFDDMPSVMDTIPFAQRVLIRLNTSTVDLAAYIKSIADAYPVGAEIKMPPGTYNISNVEIESTNLTFVMTPATIIKKYGDGGASAELRSIFLLDQFENARFTLDMNGGTIDLNGEGPKGIGIEGRIENLYASYNTEAFPDLKGIAGPGNAAIFARRSSGIRIIGRGGTIKNSGESAILFRNSGDTDVDDVRFENLANYGVEYNFAANDGIVGGTYPEFHHHSVRNCRFRHINDLGLSTGNGCGIGGGGAPGYGAIRFWNFINNKYEYCLRDLHIEFGEGGTWLELVNVNGWTSYRAGQGSTGFIGIRDSKISNGVILNPSEAPQLALTYEATLGQPGGAQYPESYGVIISTDFDDVDVENVAVIDNRTSNVIKGANGVAVAGNKTFTSATMNWTTDDIGKPIGILEAGASGAGYAILHNTEIESINSTTSIELVDPPISSVPVATFAYGGTCREPFVANTGTSISFSNIYVRGGAATGLTGSPVPSAMRLQDIAELVTLQNVRLEAPESGSSQPCGLRMVDSALPAPSTFAGLLRYDNSFIANGFGTNNAGNEIGTYDLRAKIFQPMKSMALDKALAQAAAADTYGTVEILYSDTSFLEVASLSFETAGAIGGGETITFAFQLYFYDDEDGPIVTFAAVGALGTVQVTAKQLRQANPDNVKFRAIGVMMKGSLGTGGGGTATGKVNLTCRQSV